jgi:hypothetical protein
MPAQNDTIQNTPPLEREQAQPLQTENVHFAKETTEQTQHYSLSPILKLQFFPLDAKLSSEVTTARTSCSRT